MCHMVQQNDSVYSIFFPLLLPLLHFCTKMIIKIANLHEKFEPKLENELLQNHTKEMKKRKEMLRRCQSFRILIHICYVPVCVYCVHEVSLWQNKRWNNKKNVWNWKHSEWEIAKRKKMTMNLNELRWYNEINK